VRRLTILLAAVGALLLVPAAQAFANGTVTVNVAGSGSGEVSSVGGLAAADSGFAEYGNALEGSPPIECSGPPASGTCETELVEEEEFEGFEGIALHATAVPGTKFLGWEVEGEIAAAIDCKASSSESEGCAPLVETGGGSIEVIAYFECETEGGCEGPSGPTNKRTLTLTKSPNPSSGTGLGSVSSKPKGIKCATGCTEAVGRFYKEQAVLLTAVASGETSAFDKWVGCPKVIEVTKCEVPKGTADVSVEAVFKGSSKPILSPKALTLSKGSSESNRGYGTVKATGLTCEAECDETTVLYQGPITEPKPIAAKTVELKALAAFGSKFTGWSGGGCSGTEPVCKVTMSADTTVTAEFEAVPNVALTVEKAYSGGLGTVSSKPKGVMCGTTCTQAVAQMPEGSSIVLTAKPATTEPATTFVKWEGGDCAGKTELTCTVGMDKAETVKAVFSGPVKTLANSQKLTLTKAGSGYGTVKAAGLACEALCSSATTLYYGPVTEPKPKTGAKVVLKAISAPGSKAVEWTGCESNPTPTECVVVMSESKSVTATFDELE
jgi:List-Bact-rpt repeat protein